MTIVIVLCSGPRRGSSLSWRFRLLQAKDFQPRSLRQSLVFITTRRTEVKPPPRAFLPCSPRTSSWLLPKPTDFHESQVGARAEVMVKTGEISQGEQSDGGRSRS